MIGQGLGLWLALALGSGLGLALGFGFGFGLGLWLGLNLQNAVGTHLHPPVCAGKPTQRVGGATPNIPTIEVEALSPRGLEESRSQRTEALARLG